MSYAFWFNAPLKCLSCGAEIAGNLTGLHTRGLNPEPRDEWVVPDQELALDPDDFDTTYVRVRSPTDGTDFRVIHGWCCPTCNEAQWARLVFRRESANRFRFVTAESVPLAPEELRAAHFISDDVKYWIEEGPPEETKGLSEALGTAE
ncbi:hypothetical protein WMF26_20530 [Sorangium sp. So ce185]|uniref:hypothetical protein n=1 Tax=Sorangium sp. So ce185 TaxID=3133287 RepID=UPI003F5FB91C